jgi:hypothetical protein
MPSYLVLECSKDLEGGEIADRIGDTTGKVVLIHDDVFEALASRQVSQETDVSTELVPGNVELSKRLPKSFSWHGSSK